MNSQVNDIVVHISKAALGEYLHNLFNCMSQAIYNLTSDHKLHIVSSASVITKTMQVRLITISTDHLIHSVTK